MKKKIMLAILIFLELVFPSWVVAPTRPRRNSELEAGSRYQKDPNPQNYELWENERKLTQREVMIRKGIGALLGVSDFVLMVWVYRKKPSKVPLAIRENDA